jgi:hypothetical protein
VGTEGQGLSIAWIDGLKVKCNETGVDTFRVKTLAIATTTKQTKTVSV